MMTEVIQPSTYQLKDDNSNVLTNTWNIEQLCHFSPKFSLTAFYSTLAPIKHPSLNTFSPGRSEAPWGYNNKYYLSFLLSHGKNFLPEWKGISSPWLPYVTLFLLPTERTPPWPMVTNSRASRAMPGFLKLQPTEQTDRCEKERIKTKLC